MCDCCAVESAGPAAVFVTCSYISAGVSTVLTEAMAAGVCAALLAGPGCATDCLDATAATALCALAGAALPALAPLALLARLLSCANGCLDAMAATALCVLAGAALRVVAVLLLAHLLSCAKGCLDAMAATALRALAGNALPACTLLLLARVVCCWARCLQGARASCSSWPRVGWPAAVLGIEPGQPEWDALHCAVSWPASIRIVGDQVRSQSVSARSQVDLRSA